MGEGMPIAELEIDGVSALVDSNGELTVDGAYLGYQTKSDIKAISDLLSALASTMEDGDDT